MPCNSSYINLLISRHFKVFYSLFTTWKMSRGNSWTASLGDKRRFKDGSLRFFSLQHFWHSMSISFRNRWYECGVWGSETPVPRVAIVRVQWSNLKMRCSCLPLHYPFAIWFWSILANYTNCVLPAAASLSRKWFGSCYKSLMQPVVARVFRSFPGFLLHL